MFAYEHIRLNINPLFLFLFNKVNVYFSPIGRAFLKKINGEICINDVVKGAHVTLKNDVSSSTFP